MERGIYTSPNPDSFVSEEKLNNRRRFDNPNNTIVFPDKTDHVVDWRLTFQRIGEIKKAVEAADIVQEEGEYQVKLDRPDIPMAVGFCFSDGHIGAYTSDHELMRSLFETVLTTPNSFLIDTGDTFNNGVWGTLGYEDIIPPYLQAFTIEDIIRELGDKYAACVIGNHPDWMFSSGVQPEFMFARLMRGPVFPGMGLLHIKVGNVAYDWALAHSFYGKSKKNIFNCCVNFRTEAYPSADIYTIGHEHVWGHMKEKVDGREVLYVRPGTAKTKDRYARIHGIAKRGQEFGIAVLLDARKKAFMAMSIEEALETISLWK